MVSKYMEYTTARIKKKNSKVLLNLRKDNENLDDVLTRILGTGNPDTYTALDELKRSLDQKAVLRREQDLKDHLARLKEKAEESTAKDDLENIFVLAQKKRRWGR